MRTFACTLLISLVCLAAQAKQEEQEIPKAPVFCGVAVGADLAGPVMMAVGTRFYQIECLGRLNFRDHFFPIAELGIGESDREGQKNDNTFHAQAPYFRIGMDYNLNKKHNGNRLMAGVRYGVTSFSYDFTDPDYADPVWPSESIGLYLNDQQARVQWAEFCLGCETKLWSFIRLGWTMRFKMRLVHRASDYGDPYYVPGFGKNGSSTWGGTCNLIFDVGRTSKRNR